MKTELFFLTVLVGLAVLMASCASQSVQPSDYQSPSQATNSYYNPTPKERNCNSVVAPSLSVVCRKTGVYTEFNVNTGRNEYKDRYSCYGYPRGESSISYRVWSYSTSGGDLGGGEIGSGGSVNVAINADYVEAFPNLDGYFCKNKAVRIYKNQFIYENGEVE